MPLADAHVHLFSNGYAGTWGPLLQNEVEVYEQLRALFAIDRALVVGYEGEGRYNGNNDYILSLARTRPWLVPLAYLEEDQPTLDRLRHMRVECSSVFCIYVLLESSARAVSAWSKEVLDALDRQQAIISLNATPAAAAALGPFVDSLDGCALLFSHLGLPGRFARMPSPAEARARLQALLAFADRPHVHVKFSGLYAVSDPAHDFPHPVVQPILEALIEAFGVARLCWGSDFAPALEFVSFGQIADDRLLARLDERDVAAVMGANLQRVLQSRPETE
jgi:predicted TIM-barrel fold metal-dependent hydrolase